jgi:hypothetical protein
MSTSRNRRTRLEVHFGLAVVVFATIWIAHHVSTYTYGSSVFARHERNIRMLTTVLGELERTRMRVWRMESSCVGIENASGSHGTPVNVPPCPLPQANEELAGDAQAELGAIARSLDATGVSVRAVDARYQANGRVSLARFRVDCAACGLRDYVYTIDDGALAGIVAPNTKVQSISAQWHLLEGI